MKENGEGRGERADVVMKRADMWDQVALEFDTHHLVHGYDLSDCLMIMIRLPNRVMYYVN